MHAKRPVNATQIRKSCEDRYHVHRWHSHLGCAIDALVRLRPQVLFIALLALVFVSCSSTTVGQAPEISLNIGLDPPTIDPALSTDPPTIQLDNMLFLSLTTPSEDDGSPQPALAREWLVSSDGLIWEFRLRDDVYWVQYNTITGRSQKKRAVTANDVVYSLRRLFDPRTQSTFAHIFAPLISGAAPFNNADPRTAPQDLDRLASAIGVTAKDAQTVQFHLTRPMSAFPTLAATWLGRVEPHEPIDESGIDWTSPGTIWTSGPYMLESWDHNQSIVVRRNPYYFAADQVQAERLHFKMVPDAGSALDAYLNGDLDTTDPYDTIEGDQLTRVDEDQSLLKDRHVLPGLCTQYIGFDVRQAPFDDVRVRRAFATALNRDDIATKIFKTGQVARWFTPPGMNASPDISSTIGIQFNAPQAKDLLDQSGWGSARKRLPLLTFAVNTNDAFDQLAVSASQDWKAALSASVQVDSTDDWATYLDKLRTKPAPIFRMGYCASYPDAANFAYDVFHSGSEYNFTHWSSADYDRLVEQAARETDVIKRRELYLAAEKILVQDQVVIIPLLWTTRISLSNPHLQRTFAIMEGYDHIENWRQTQ
jgi:oligopeptide transport system substrate-binding protein